MRNLLYVALMAIAFIAPVNATESEVFDPDQFKNEIVIPTLESMEPVFPGASNPAAVNLMIGIAYHESHGGTYLRQKGDSGGVVLNGGLGVYQVEATTHRSLYNHFLRYRPDRIEFAKAMLPIGSVIRISASEFEVDDRPLITNLAYATFVARVRIYKERFSWPDDPADLQALGQIWDDKYNRNPHHGFPSQFVADFPKRVLG